MHIVNNINQLLYPIKDQVLLNTLKIFHNKSLKTSSISYIIIMNKDQFKGNLGFHTL